VPDVDSYCIKKRKKMNIRKINKEEISKLRDIDRSETVNQIYYAIDGSLVLRDKHYDVPKWSDGALRGYMKALTELFDRGGVIFGVFDDEKMVGIMALGSKMIGKNRDRIVLDFMHISKDYRKRGLGKRLVDMARSEAKKMNARKLYISACPTKNMVDFYMKNGAIVTEDIDKEMFEKEPDDIHMEVVL
jgi:GNAT superfamily N-acetyltransferase